MSITAPPTPSLDAVRLKVAELETKIQILTSNAEKIDTSTNSVTYITLIIAITSIILTVISIYYSRKHQRLSLRPLPQVTLGDYSNEIYVRIDNNGPGPLIIKDFKCTNASGKNIIEKDNLFDALPIAPDLVWRNFAKDLNNRSIKPFGKLNLIEYDVVGNNRKSSVDQELLQFELSKCAIEFDYYDIFQKKIGTYKRTLEWFDR